MKVYCPKCYQKYDIDEKYSGYEIECLKCGKSFILPTPSSKKTNESSSDKSSKKDEG